MIWSTEKGGQMMLVKNDYNHTLTNIGASIQKYFDVKPNHKTFSELDELLKAYSPKNVVVILLDGLGANVLAGTMPKISFMRANTKNVFPTVFPATTAAATTSLRTGLNPVEHGYIGWTAYIKPIDKVVTLLTDSEKGKDGEICKEYLAIKNNELRIETIVEQINSRNKAMAIEIFPFGENAYHGFDEMLERIEDETKNCGKRYIYAYSDEPDTTMHDYGPNSNDVKQIIIEQDKKIAALTERLHNTLLVVLADHGHIKTKTIYLENYPDIIRLMTHKTSVDQRATVFKIKEGKKDEFQALFSKYFGKHYDLYDSCDVKKSGLFGDGTRNSLFSDMLGDYLAIAKDEIVITAPGDHFHVSHHAGYTDDEVLVPFIAKYCE